MSNETSYRKTLREIVEVSTILSNFKYEDLGSGGVHLRKYIEARGNLIDRLDKLNSRRKELEKELGYI